MRTARTLPLLLALLSPVPAAAQSTLETVWSDVKTVPGDVWHVWSAPARIRADDVPTIVAFTGGTLLVALNDGAIRTWVDEHPDAVAIRVLEPFRAEHQALSELGRNHKILRGAAAGYVVGLVTGWDWLREASFGCALGNTANSLGRQAVYGLISRTRPSSSTDPYQFDVPGGEWEEHSFFGGHAANAFTCASFFAHRWDLGYGEPVVWALATGVALGRMPDDAHWASDTLVGIGFGYVVGRMIAGRYLERDARAAQGEAREPVSGEGASLAPDATERAGWRRVELGAVPVETPAGPALMLSASLRF